MRLKITLQNDPTPEAQEFVVNYQELADKFIKENYEAGVQAGLLRAQELVEQKYQAGVQAGVQTGLLAGLRDTLLDLLTTRALPLTKAQRDRVLAESDAQRLRQWVHRAITAASVDDVFAD